VSVLILAWWHSLLPSIGPATYSYDGHEDRRADLPVDVATAGHHLHVRFDMRVGALHPTLFSVRPDDRLDSLTVDGQPVHIGKQPCFPDGGTVSLAGALHRGDNAVDMQIEDSGGRGGVGFAVSIVDPLFVGIVCFVGLLTMVFVAYALRTIGAGRLAVPVIATIVVALAVRLPLITEPGYAFDTGLDAHWAKSAVVLGIGPSYLHQIDDTPLPNYPPLQMAVFAGTGRAYRALLSPNYDLSVRDCIAFMKLPGVLADVAAAVVLLFLARRISVVRCAPWIAGLGYAVQPGVLYESAVWGQVDSIFALGVLGALIAALSKRWFVMGALLSAALLTKFQAVVALPVVVAVCVVERRITRPLLGALSATLPALALLRSWPVMAAAKDVYTHSSGFFPFLSMYAYNVWVALYGLGSRQHTDADTFLGPLTYRHVGLAVFAVIAIAAAVIGARRLRKATTLADRAWILFAVPAVTVYAFFLFNTEMHERYLFLLLPLGIPVVLTGPGLRPYLAASLLFFINVIGVLPWTPLDRAAFKEFPNLPGLIGVCNVLVFVAMFRLFVRGRAQPLKQPPRPRIESDTVTGLASR